MKLPRPHFSFSQLELWLTSKESYRKKYYPKVSPKAFSTIFTRFGNHVTECMERGEKWVAFIPHFKMFELKVEVEVEGIPILAYIDNVDTDAIAFKEQKTTMVSWSVNKIMKHRQLPFYSLILQILFGKVTDLCHLVWVGTKKVEKDVVVLGEVIGTTFEMALTGKFKETPRIITQDDRDDMRKLIVSCAREIEEDYAALGHLY